MNLISFEAKLIKFSDEGNTPDRKKYMNEGVSQLFRGEFNAVLFLLIHEPFNFTAISLKSWLLIEIIVVLKQISKS